MRLLTKLVKALNCKRTARETLKPRSHRILKKHHDETQKGEKSFHLVTEIALRKTINYIRWKNPIIQIKNAN